jgi:GNAT superfamily N-acetyltransferase
MSTMNDQQSGQPGPSETTFVAHTATARRDSSSTAYSIRPARPDDAELLVSLVRELAVYEKLEQYARATPDDFRRYLFGPRPAAEAVVAEAGNEPAGFALWYHTFSTFRGCPGIYLEDIFVRPAYRGRGIGKALLATVAAEAVELGQTKLEWSVLNWNEPAMGFYRSLGAWPMDDWMVYRIDGDGLKRLAAMANGVGAPSSGTR